MVRDALARMEIRDPPPQGITTVDCCLNDTTNILRAGSRHVAANRELFKINPLPAFQHIRKKIYEVYSIWILNGSDL